MKKVNTGSLIDNKGERVVWFDNLIGRGDNSPSFPPSSPLPSNGDDNKPKCEKCNTNKDILDFYP